MSILWPRRAIRAAWFLAASASFPQSRDAYRSAYSDWRQVDPTLERDAVNGGLPLASRAAKAAQAALRYKAARTTFLRDASHQLNLKLAPLEAISPADLELAPPRDNRAFLAAESKTADAAIKTFQTDRDPSLVKIRQALERERAALQAVSDAHEATLQAVTKAAQAGAALEATRKALLESYQDMNTALQQAAEDSDRESALWSDYYRKLSPPTQAAVPAFRPAQQ